MVYGRVPFRAPSVSALLTKLSSNPVVEFPDLVNSNSSNAKNQTNNALVIQDSRLDDLHLRSLITGLLEPDVSKRLTLKQAITHEWTTGEKNDLHRSFHEYFESLLHITYSQYIFFQLKEPNH